MSNVDAGRFYKLTGSGNDFVYFDTRAVGGTHDADPLEVAALCARGTGIGADGVVLLAAPTPQRVQITYYNSDGSRATLCGNATLCAISLSVHLGIVPVGHAFEVVTDAGVLGAQTDAAGLPSFRLPPVRDVSVDLSEPRAGRGPAGEVRLGAAIVGVPHVVAKVSDAEAVSLGDRGAELRQATRERPDGANVNFVSPLGPGQWRLRTYERGVEGETLACGTGAVATAALLSAWGDGGPAFDFITASGRSLRVTYDGPAAAPLLSGEGRLVFVGRLLV